MAIKNSQQLMDHILKTIDDIDGDKVTLDKANALFRGAAAAINVQRMQMKYSEMKGEVPNLEFLESKDK